VFAAGAVPLDSVGGAYRTPPDPVAGWGGEGWKRKREV